MSPKKPALFVALDGPVLTVHGELDPMLGHPVSGYAKPFLHWAKNHFDVCLITDRALRDAFHLIDKFDLPKHAVSVRGYMDSKLEAVDTGRDFYWLDSDLIPSEINWLSQHGKGDRFMPVLPTQGVTPEHKKYLESQLKRR